MKSHHLVVIVEASHELENKKSATQISINIPKMMKQTITFFEMSILVASTSLTSPQNKFFISSEELSG